MKLTILLFLCCFIIACKPTTSTREEQKHIPIIKLTSTIDPLCKMDIRTNYSDTLIYQEKIYGFCSIVCKERFIEKIKKKNAIHIH